MNTNDFIKRYLKPNKSKFIIMIITSILYALFNLLSPLVFSFYIDNVIGDTPIANPFLNWFADLLGGRLYLRDNLWIGAILIVLVTLFMCFFAYQRGKMNGLISENMVYDIRNDLYSHMQRLPYHYHVKVKTGDLIQRCTSDIDVIRKVFAGQISELVYAIMTAVIAMIVLFNIYTPMALVTILPMSLIILYAYFFFKKMQKAFLDSDEKEGILVSKIQENLSGIRVTKAFNKEKYEIEDFEKKNRTFKDVTFEMIKLLGQYWSISDFICLSLVLLILILGIFNTNAGNITIGQFFVFVTYESSIIWPVRNIGRLIADISKMGVSIKRLNEILNEQEEDLTSGSKPDLRGDITFDKVHFRYPDGNKDVLNGISFDIKKGETVAILGPTGSGKSSLVHLLSRLYDYTGGSIKINNNELKDINKEYLRKKVGIVLQEPFLFSKSIYENIHMANRNASEQDVQQASSIASIDEVIKEFSEGYDTLVGEKGVTLSGGQKQRIAIARTIVNDVDLLIFDDSLSAVDTQTDAAIRKALKTFQHKVTTIIITQRIASAKEADQIIVIEDGYITQHGTHEQLCNEEGLYKRVNDLQNNIITESEVAA